MHESSGRFACMARKTELTLAGGTEGSNPAPSSGESVANLTSSPCRPQVGICIETGKGLLYCFALFPVLIGQIH